MAFVASAPPVKDPWQGLNLPDGLRFYFAKKYFASIDFYINRLLPDFVTEEEETELLETFHWEENDGKMKHRQVKQRLTY